MDGLKRWLMVSMLDHFPALVPVEKQHCCRFGPGLLRVHSFCFRHLSLLSCLANRNTCCTIDMPATCCTIDSQSCNDQLLN
jgi:hypothetical protein